MITVKKDSWHARLYTWWYQQKYGKEVFAGFDMDTYREKYVPNIPKRSNLCPYMRAVMLWSWLRWLFIAGKIKKFPVPIISWLFLAVEVPRWLGILSYPLKQALLCAYVAAFTMAAALALCGAVSVLDDKTMVFEPIRKAKNAVREFCSLLGQYLRAKHDRICPEITFAEAGQ